MECYENVAGATGEVEVQIPEKKNEKETFSFSENFIMQTQYVEYKLSHYYEKSYEFLFNFMSVLPGAFSTLRWEAL